MQRLRKNSALPGLQQTYRMGPLGKADGMQKLQRRHQCSLESPPDQGAASRGLSPPPDRRSPPQGREPGNQPRRTVSQIQQQMLQDGQSAGHPQTRKLGN